ncbi:MAG: diguanylate cyclase domain-containing protein [Acidimicrobiales bacterium]
MRRREAGLPAAPPPPSGFLQGLVDGLPATLLVVDGSGVVRFAGGQLGLLFRWGYGDLVGRPLSDYAIDEHRPGLSEVLDLASRAGQGEVVGPFRLPFRDLDSSVRNTEVWVMNRAHDPSVNGLVVLLLAESAYVGFDGVLEAIVAGAPLEAVFGGLVQALRRPPVGAESFFSFMGGDDRGVMRVPRIPEVPGPPLNGPWEQVWAEGGTVEHESLEALPGTLRGLAREAGFRAVSCLAVKERADHKADASLVLWRRELGPMTPFAFAAARRAAALATLASSRAGTDSSQLDVGPRDPLTGLGSRHSFLESLEDKVRAGLSPVVLCVGLEDLSDVNERLGHLAGDAVLRVTARRLVSVTRPTDELARLGGSEFAVCCQGTISEPQVLRIAARVVGQLSKPLSVGDGEALDVGASIGIAANQPTGTSADTLLGRADHALVEAKTRGRRQWVLADAS